MNKIVKRVLLFVAAVCLSAEAMAQEKIVNPDITYAGSPRECVIAGIAVSGVEGYEDYMLAGISGLTVGQEVSLPGQEITDAVKRYWRHGLFSKVTVAADSIVGDKLYLHFYLATRPRVSVINYTGVKKSEKSDLEAKLGLLKGSQITPNMIDRAKTLAAKYFKDKGFNNAEINISQIDDLSNKNHVILNVDVDKKEKIKIRHIILEGNKELTDKKIKGGLFSKGALGKIREAGKLSSFMKATKFTPERYKEGKQKLIDKYYELGYRDAEILDDSVWTNDPKHVNVYEGKRRKEILYPQHHVGGKHRVLHRLPQPCARHEEGRRLQPEAAQQATERRRGCRGKQLLERRLPLL